MDFSAQLDDLQQRAAAAMTTRSRTHGTVVSNGCGSVEGTHTASGMTPSA